MAIATITLAIVLLFGFVVLFGAPYLPTLKPQAENALDLIGLKKGQTLLELGSGDGRVLRLAASRGLYAVGYEINPLLVIVSFIVTFKYRKQVKIVWGNYWKKTWPKADGIFVFLLDRYMTKLDKKIASQNQKLKVVSYSFKIPGKRIAKSKNPLYLYEYN